MSGWELAHGDVGEILDSVCGIDQPTDIERIDDGDWDTIYHLGSVNADWPLHVRCMRIGAGSRATGPTERILRRREERLARGCGTGCRDRVVGAQHPPCRYHLAPDHPYGTGCESRTEGPFAAEESAKHVERLVRIAVGATE